jgi:hypothetical protein
MNRPKEWHSVLDAEVRRWSAMSWEQLESALRDLHTYEVEFNSKTYQVEVELLENTEKHLHVMLAVDDGRFPASAFPANPKLRARKAPASARRLIKISNFPLASLRICGRGTNEPVEPLGLLNSGRKASNLI